MSEKNIKQRFGEQEDLTICKELIDRELEKNENEIDTDAIDRWVDEALQLQGLKYCADEQADEEEIKQVFARFVSSEQQNGSETPRHRIRKVIISALAAAFLLAALSLTAYGFFGPSETFMQNIRQILGLERGEVLITSEGDNYADSHVKEYSSLDECMQTENISLLVPKDVSIAPESIVTYGFDSSANATVVSCVYSNRVSVDIFLENAPYSKDVMETQEDLDRVQVNYRTYYVIDRPRATMFVLFDAEYVYVFSASSKEQILEIVNQI